MNIFALLMERLQTLLFLPLFFVHLLLGGGIIY